MKLQLSNKGHNLLYHLLHLSSLDIMGDKSNVLHSEQVIVLKKC